MLGANTFLVWLALDSSLDRVSVASVSPPPILTRTFCWVHRTVMASWRTRGRCKVKSLCVSQRSMMRGSTTTSRRAAVAPAARNSVSHATEAIISIRQAHGFMAKNHTGLLMYRAMRQLRLLKVMKYPKITGHSACLASANTFDDILRSQHGA